MWETYRLSKHYRKLPSDLWGWENGTPKAFYLNRGVWLFGSMVEGEMQEAEQAVRKRSKGGRNGNVNKFVASERLRVLGKHLQEDIKRFRDPGAAVKTVKPQSTKDVDGEQILGADFFKLKTK